MAILYIPMGLPGCGKSTFASKIMSHAVRVSSDDIREQLTGDATNQSRNDEVFKQYYHRITLMLSSGRSVYADATNLRDFARRDLRNIAQNRKIETHLFVFNNIEQAVRRNATRERVVPEDVMGRFMYQFEKALVDIQTEPYTSITYIEGVQ